jgi:pilus assembly protein CpaB
MKRNLIPLLAVAFIVAILSTGIFYGLFAGKLKAEPTQKIVVAAKPLRPGAVIARADLGTMAWSGAQVPRNMFSSASQVIGQTLLQGVEPGDPILQLHLMSSVGAVLGVPEGMRAVSVHVADSTGVLALLRPGHKVDVQVFATRQTPHGAESEARTAFQNLRVLGVAPQTEASSQGNYNAPVVTLLASPAEADALGVADAFGKLRLALRNPVDEAREQKITLPLAVLFRSRSPIATPGDGEGATATTMGSGTKVALAVQLLSASPDAITALEPYGVSGQQDVLNASQSRGSNEIEKAIAELREAKSVDVLSLARVNTALSRSATVDLDGRSAGGLRVQFSPFMAHGQMKLRVQPEVTMNGGPAPGTRRWETEVDLAKGRSFVITGLKGSASFAEKPGAEKSGADGRRLLVLVTPVVHR